MTAGRRRGFTLIELLVVIAIIAILAAMLFPVFARARESARKIQCLSNVKNIAIAFQMYLTDYDRFPPTEHRADAIAFFDTAPGGGDDPYEGCPKVWQANPYLRWPVVLDEYVKNRDVWRCPSAKHIQSAGWIVPGSDWLGFLMQTQGSWGNSNCDGGGPCVGTCAFPPGWGGSVTDSVTQQACGSQESGAFEQSIGVSGYSSKELKTSQIEDPSWYVVCGDCGVGEEYLPGNYAFADACRVDCGCSGGWVNCSDTQSCSPGYPLMLYTDPTSGKRFTRHMGGSNLGFADGHAAWFDANAIIAQSPRSWDQSYGKLRGIQCTSLGQG